MTRVMSLRVHGVEKSFAYLLPFPVTGAGEDCVAGLLCGGVVAAGVGVRTAASSVPSSRSLSGEVGGEMVGGDDEARMFRGLTPDNESAAARGETGSAKDAGDTTLCGEPSPGLGGDLAGTTTGDSVKARCPFASLSAAS